MKLIELLETVSNIEQNILHLKKQIHELKQNQYEIEKELDKIELTKKYDILILNKVENGIKLTNQDQRNVYIQYQLQNDKQYQSLLKELGDIIRSISRLEFQIEELYIEYRYYSDLINFGNFDPEDDIL